MTGSVLFPFSFYGFLVLCLLNELKQLYDALHPFLGVRDPFYGTCVPYFAGTQTGMERSVAGYIVQ